MSLREEVNSVLQSMNPREEAVVRMRFGIGGPALTLAEVGQKFSISSERVRQIEAKVLRKLRHPLKSRPLRKAYHIERLLKSEPLD